MEDNWIIQERYGQTDWQMLICCLLLNQTSNKQVKPILDEFFSRYPGPEALAASSQEELIPLIRSLGFYNKRSATLIRFSKEYLEKSWTDPRDLHGIGKYAYDSYRIFILGETEIEVEDKVLAKYLKEKYGSHPEKTLC